MPMKPKHTYSVQAGDETSAAAPRRLSEGFYDKYLDEGRAILEIGPGHAPIVPYAETWDIAQGDPDASYMAGKADNTYDTIYSSHVLEHVDNPQVALEHWLRILKPEGYLIVSVPDEDLYEQGIWPSVYNPDHKHSFTTYKSQSWNKANSINLLDMIKSMEGVKLISLRITDTNYDYTTKYVDQKNAEKSVEMILQKQGLQFALRDSMYTRFTCYCGSTEVHLEGIYKNGELLVRCRSCGHFAKNDVKVILKNLGYSIERNTTIE